MRRLLCSISLLATTLYVTGCGFTNDKILSTAPAGKGTHGTVHGGQAPVVGATVSVFALGIGGPPTLLATTTSDSAGNFAFGGVGTTYSCGSLLASKSPVSPHQAPQVHPHSDSQKSTKVSVGGGPTGFKPSSPATLPSSTDTYVYITATGGDSGAGPNSKIALVAALGKCIDAQNETVEINEVSTVILANVMGNFTDFVGDMAFFTSDDPYMVNAMEIADTNTFQTLDDLATGTVNPNTVSTTGGTSITIEAAKIYSIANTIASCVNSADQPTTPVTPSAACQTLFADVPQYADKSAFDTFSAATFMAYVPTANVSELYQLAGSKPPFVGLSTAPNDWSVGVSYNTTAMGLAIYKSEIGGGSSSTIDLDSSSRVWFPSNKSGANGIAYFDPTDNTFNGPYNSSVTPLSVPQYVALDDANQIAWATDLFSNDLLGVSTAPGSEGAIVYTYDFHDSSPASSPNPYGLGPLFVNSDSSVVFNYDNSYAIPNQVTFVPSTASVEGETDFALQPTGLTVNTTQGSDANDPTAPGVVAATSDLNTACNVEFTSASDGSFVFLNDTSCTLSGGIATTAYNNVNGNQDQVAALTSANAFCSEFLAAGSGTVAGSCSSIPEYLSSPEGVAVDGGNEIWFANRGNGSIFQVQGTYEDGGTPDYSLVGSSALLHGAGNGGTMTEPTGIAVDRAGNIWVSNTSCSSTGDTTCTYTLSEVFATGVNTFTPLSLQAARLQGTQPPVGSTEGAGTPHPMSRGKNAMAHTSLAHKSILSK